MNSEVCSIRQDEKIAVIKRSDIEHPDWDEALQEWRRCNPLLKRSFGRCKKCGLQYDFIGHRHDINRPMTEEEARDIMEDWLNRDHECPASGP